MKNKAVHSESVLKSKSNGRSHIGSAQKNILKPSKLQIQYNTSGKMLNPTTSKDKISNHLQGQAPTPMEDEDPTSGYEYPNKRKISKTIDPNQGQAKKIATQNRFGLLNTDQGEDNVSPQQPPPENKRKWIPPITITNKCEDYSKLVKEIRTILEHDKFQIQLNRNNTKIFVYTNDDFDKITFEFTQLKVQYFTLTRKEDKVKKVVLKAPPTWKSDEILQNLQKEGKLVNEVIPLKSRKRDITHSYLVTLPAEQKINELKEIKAIENCKIKWEHYAKKRNYTQCYRCQEFGHSQANCFKKPRCVKCPEFHLYTNCKLQKGPETVPFCHNCKGQHAANYSKCEALIEYLQKRNNRQNIPTQPQINLSPESNNYEKQFPNKLKIPQSQNDNNKMSYKDKLTSTPPNQNDNSDFTEVIRFVKIIKQLKQDIINCNDDIDKVEVVLRYLQYF